MCKPQKQNGAGGLRDQVNKTGFGNIRSEAAVRKDVADLTRGSDPY